MRERETTALSFLLSFLQLAFWSPDAFPPLRGELADGVGGREGGGEGEGACMIHGSSRWGVCMCSNSKRKKKKKKMKKKTNNPLFVCNNFFFLAKKLFFLMFFIFYNNSKRKKRKKPEQHCHCIAC